MGGIFGLGGSSSKTDRKHSLEGWGALKDIMYNTKASGLKQTAEGAGGLTSAADYFKALMSGDQAKMSQVLAPQISVIKGQNQQRVNTLAQFGNRSGGTNAAAQSDTEAATKSIQQLFDMLGPQAAEEVARISGVQESLGSNLLGISTHAAGTLSGQAEQARAGDTKNEMDTAAGAGQAIAALLGIL